MYDYRYTRSSTMDTPLILAHHTSPLSHAKRPIAKRDISMYNILGKQKNRCLLEHAMSCRATSSYRFVSRSAELKLHILLDSYIPTLSQNQKPGHFYRNSFDRLHEIVREHNIRINIANHRVTGPRMYYQKNQTDLGRSIFTPDDV